MTAANEVVFLLDVDNTLRILAAIKKVWGERADLTIQRIGDLVNYGLPALLGGFKAGDAQ